MFTHADFYDYVHCVITGPTLVDRSFVPGYTAYGGIGRIGRIWDRDGEGEVTL